MNKIIYKSRLEKYKNILPWFFCAVILLFSSIIFPIPDVLGAEIEKLNNGPQAEEMLMTGLIDLTLLLNNNSGNIEEIVIGDEFKKEIILTGKTVFFLKGKIEGKYLLTARLDTGKGKDNELRQDIFRQSTVNTINRIDPERYYPVYGDDSKVVNMVGNQGKLYIDLSWDNTELLWGNYKYINNENELVKYNRSLYGFKFKTKFGKRDGEESPLDIKGFWSSPESVHAHNELKIIGGMLYYLKHANIIIGSDDIKIEIRDNLTEELEESIQLIAGVDYDIDYLSGRLILKTYLNDYLFDEGDEKSSFLITDYEYEPISSLADQSSYGVNIDFNYHNSNINSSYTTEIIEDGARYESSGIVYNYIDKNHDFAVEWANTRDKIGKQYFSEDGGLTYNLLTNTDNIDSANAYRIRYQTEIKNKNLLNTNLPGLGLTVIYSHKDKGFSSQHDNVEEDTDSYNLQLKGGSEKLSYITKYYVETKESSQSNTADLKVKKEINDKLELAGELRQINKLDDKNNTSSQLTTGIDFTYQIDESKQIYGGQDLSLSGKKLNETTLGAKLKPKDNITLDAAVIMDNVSQSGNEKYKLGGSYKYKYGEVYSSLVTESTGDSSLLLGGNTDLNEKTNLYIEHKTTEETDENSDSNVFGVNYKLNNNWSLVFDYTRSNVIKKDDSQLSRDIITPAVLYRGDDMTYKAKMEYRKEDGNEDLSQYVFTSGFNKECNEDVSLLFNLDYSLTQRDSDIDEKDSFTDAQLGLAYRPVKNDRLNLLAMYTYQEEYSPEDQENASEYNERSNIFSIEGIYDINNRWQLGEKLAWKKSQLINDGISAVSDTYLWINRLSYNAREDWDLYGEYRVLQNTQAEDQKSGFLIGVNKGLGNNMKLGVGYNFTDFNDDLTDLDYYHQGLFINVVRKW